MGGKIWDGRSGKQVALLPIFLQDRVLILAGAGRAEIFGLEQIWQIFFFRKFFWSGGRFFGENSVNFEIFFQKILGFLSSKDGPLLPNFFQNLIFLVAECEST